SPRFVSDTARGIFGVPNILGKLPARNNCRRSTPCWRRRSKTRRSSIRCFRTRGGYGLYLLVLPSQWSKPRRVFRRIGSFGLGQGHHLDFPQQTDWYDHGSHHPKGSLASKAGTGLVESSRAILRNEDAEPFRCSRPQRRAAKKDKANTGT